MPVLVAPGLAETGTPGDLIRRRPDLIVVERRLAAANARIGVAIAEYYPKFSLGALLGSATTISSGNLFTNGATQALGVLGLRWRLFDFGRVDAQIAAARGQEAEALAAYRSRKAILWFWRRADWTGFKHSPRHCGSCTASMSSWSRSISLTLRQSSNCISGSANEALRSTSWSTTPGSDGRARSSMARWTTHSRWCSWILRA